MTPMYAKQHDIKCCCFCAAEGQGLCLHWNGKLLKSIFWLVLCYCGWSVYVHCVQDHILTGSLVSKQFGLLFVTIFCDYLEMIVLPLFPSAVTSTLKNWRDWKVLLFSFPVFIFFRDLMAKSKLQEYKGAQTNEGPIPSIHLPKHCPCDANKVIHYTTYSVF